MCIRDRVQDAVALDEVDDEQVHLAVAAAHGHLVEPGHVLQAQELDGKALERPAADARAAQVGILPGLGPDEGLSLIHI